MHSPTAPKQSANAERVSAPFASFTRPQMVQYLSIPQLFKFRASVRKHIDHQLLEEQIDRETQSEQEALVPGIKFCVTTPTSTAVKQTLALTYRFMGKYSDSGHFLLRPPGMQECTASSILIMSSWRK